MCALRDNCRNIALYGLNLRKSCTCWKLKHDFCLICCRDFNFNVIVVISCCKWNKLIRIVMIYIYTNIVVCVWLRKVNYFNRSFFRRIKSSGCCCQRVKRIIYLCKAGTRVVIYRPGCLNSRYISIHFLLGYPFFKRINVFTICTYFHCSFVSLGFSNCCL